MTRSAARRRPARAAAGAVDRSRGQRSLVKFSLAGDQGLGILAAGSPVSQRIACDSSAPLEPIEETATAGSSGLQYDAFTDRYTYVWKTLKGWANSCRQLNVKLDDGSDHLASFQFR
jgi:hypothetical protein